MSTKRANRRNRWAKRLLDLTIAIPILLLLSPVMILVSLLLRFAMGSPILFRQQRPGLDGRLFVLFKFRTMTNARDAHGQLLPDAQRLGRVGKFVRRYSLDELPQLFNVLRGDMSLVGPRPLLVRYLDRYSPEQARRHEVVPGMTGWSQVNARNARSWEERFKLDVWYVDHASLWLDLRILARTVGKVIKAEGVMEEGGAVAPEFWGPQGPPADGRIANPADEVEPGPGNPPLRGDVTAGR